MTASLAPLWAAHVADGVLAAPWLTGGFVISAILVLIGGWRVRDEDIPRIALLTAAFFVASLFHVRVGPTSVHLLLNGLLGVVLGRHAALAIPVGLFLQAALTMHGGFYALGVNSVVMTLPALVAWQLFGLLQRLPWVRRPWFRAALVAISTMIWILSCVFSVALLVSNPLGKLETLDTGPALHFTMQPLVLAAVLLLGLLAAWVERRLENAPEFPLGLLLGETAVLLTTGLLCLVLWENGEGSWHTLALLTFVVHLPIAVIEGVVLGFTVGFLARVKPEMIGWLPTEDAQCSVDPLR